MKEQESYRVKELVLLKESYEGGLSHRESCLVHGVSYNTSRYALYRCGEYLKFARSHGIVRSMSGKGSCYDNAVIESHFGNLKGWLGKLDRIPAGKAVEMIDGAVRYFNEGRILLKLGGSLPRSTCGSM